MDRRRFIFGYEYPASFQNADLDVAERGSRIFFYMVIAVLSGGQTCKLQMFAVSFPCIQDICLTEHAGERKCDRVV